MDLQPCCTDSDCRQPGFLCQADPDLANSDSQYCGNNLIPGSGDGDPTNFCVGHNYGCSVWDSIEDVQEVCKLGSEIPHCPQGLFGGANWREVNIRDGKQEVDMKAYMAHACPSGYACPGACQYDGGFPEKLSGAFGYGSDYEDERVLQDKAADVGSVCWNKNINPTNPLTRLFADSIAKREYNESSRAPLNPDICVKGCSDTQGATESSICPPGTYSFGLLPVCINVGEECAFGSRSVSSEEAISSEIAKSSTTGKALKAEDVNTSFSCKNIRTGLPTNKIQTVSPFAGAGSWRHCPEHTFPILDETKGAALTGIACQALVRNILTGETFFATEAPSTLETTTQGALKSYSEGMNLNLDDMFLAFPHGIPLKEGCDKDPCEGKNPLSSVDSFFFDCSEYFDTNPDSPTYQGKRHACVCNETEDWIKNSVIDQHLRDINDELNSQGSHLGGRCPYGVFEDLLTDPEDLVHQACEDDSSSELCALSVPSAHNNKTFTGGCEFQTRKHVSFDPVKDTEENGSRIGNWELLADRSCAKTNCLNFRWDVFGLMSCPVDTSQVNLAGYEVVDPLVGLANICNQKSGKVVIPANGQSGCGAGFACADLESVKRCSAGQGAPSGVESARLCPLDSFCVEL